MKKSVVTTLHATVGELLKQFYESLDGQPSVPHGKEQNLTSHLAGDRDNLEFTLLVDPPTMSPRSFKLVINNRELASRIASLSTEGQTLIFQMLVAAFTKDQDVSRVDISFRWTPSGGLRTMRAEEGGDCIFLTLL